jgi:hypothetical protein
MKFYIFLIGLVLSIHPVFATQHCTTAPGHVFVLLQSNNGDSWPGTGTNDLMTVLQDPSAGSLTMEVGTGKCGSVDGGPGVDSNYPVSSTYRSRNNLLVDTNPTQDLQEKFILTYFRDATPALGTTYYQVQKLGTTTCTVGSMTFWKTCLAPLE